MLVRAVDAAMLLEWDLDLKLAAGKADGWLQWQKSEIVRKHEPV